MGTPTLSLPPHPAQLPSSLGSTTTLAHCDSLQVAPHICPHTRPWGGWTPGYPSASSARGRCSSCWGWPCQHRGDGKISHRLLSFSGSRSLLWRLWTAERLRPPSHACQGPPWPFSPSILSSGFVLVFTLPNIQGYLMAYDDSLLICNWNEHLTYPQKMTRPLIRSLPPRLEMQLC